MHRGLERHALTNVGRLFNQQKELDHFIQTFPHAGDMTLVKASRERIDRARRA